LGYAVQKLLWLSIASTLASDFALVVVFNFLFNQMAWSIVIHGGAGVISPDLPEERVKPYKAALADCIKIGAEILKSNGTATDAVVFKHYFICI
jgi:hypothetical protein